jgi:benzodiazapine receptor
MHPKTLVTTAGAVFATAALGGLASRPAESSWYSGLNQPPRQAFPIVWAILYADIAAVSASVLDNLRAQDREQARTYAALLAPNLVLNAGWTWLFFTRRQLGASALAAALTASSADLTRRAIAARGSSGAVLGLYPL